MQDTIGKNNNIPISCFFSSPSDHHSRKNDRTAVITRPGQSAVTCVYRTKIADRSHLITVTWCKSHALLRTLSVSVSAGPGAHERHSCTVELKPWHFWRRLGSKRLSPATAVYWDLRAAKFLGETEPIAESYFVAVVHGGEVVLLLGDLRKDAYKKTGCRPALVDPTLVSRKEHVFGKRRFSTRARFDHEKGKLHEICIEFCKVMSSGSDVNNGDVDEAEMEIRLDGNVMVKVKNLQWKFRGNESVHVDKVRVEVFWDVHDWLFSPGLRHALFIFKPVSAAAMTSSFSSPALTPVSSRNGSSESFESLSGGGGGGASEFCLFLYAWKVG